MAKSNQLTLLNRAKSAYGGDLLKTRAGRAHGRPLSTRETMHLVMRSSKAKGVFSLRHPRNIQRVRSIVEKFAKKNGVQILSFANVGNHLHLQIKLTKRFLFAPFIRAVTGGIAQVVANSKTFGKFWDRRPFTRIVHSFCAFNNLKKYVRVNQLEAEGYRRDKARFMVSIEEMLARGD